MSAATPLRQRPWQRRPWRRPEVFTAGARVTPAVLARLEALIAEGLTHAIVAQRIGVHPNTVGLWVAFLDLSHAPRCRRCGARPRGCRGHAFEGSS